MQANTASGETRSARLRLRLVMSTRENILKYAETCERKYAKPVHGRESLRQGARKVVWFFLDSNKPGSVV